MEVGRRSSKTGIWSATVWVITAPGWPKKRGFAKLGLLLAGREGCSQAVKKSRDFAEPELFSLVVNAGS